MLAAPPATVEQMQEDLNRGFGEDLYTLEKSYGVDGAVQWARIFIAMPRHPGLWNTIKITITLLVDIDIALIRQFIGQYRLLVTREPATNDRRMMPLSYKLEADERQSLEAEVHLYGDAGYHFSIEKWS